MASSGLHMDDFSSVGARVSWGAICAGCMTALGMYFLLVTLGAAVGWSISDRMSADNLQTGAIIWAFLTSIAALFVGGLISSLFTVGEDKIEGTLHGVVTWALLFTVLLILGTLGIRTGFNAMTAVATTAAVGPAENWQQLARQNGVPAERIAEWDRQAAQGQAPAIADAPDREAIKATATRLSWLAFAGTWLSMIAAAVGGYVGAGPVFRFVVIRSSHHMAVS